MRTAFRLTIAALGLAIFNVSTVVVEAQFNYTTTNDAITITGYTGSGGDLIIPDTINGLPVTSIGNGAFWLCTSLTSVTIPKSVTGIGTHAFEQCTSLASVTIGNGVTSIGAWAFHYCISLSSVSIPRSVTTIEDCAFFHCASLAEITVDTLNPNYSSVDGVLLDKGQATIIQCPGGRSGSYAIPESVTSIGPYSFEWCMSLTNVTMSDTVTSIGREAFAICGNLASVTLSRSISALGDLAFGLCTNLAVVFIPGGVTNIGPQAFASCPNLKAVYFQGNAPAVSSSSFEKSALARIYYLPGTAGWGPNLGDRPTAPWVLPYPLILSTTAGFGIDTDRFGFIISWATNTPVVVEAATSLASPTWYPLATNTLTSGSAYFNDPQWTNYLSRFYRVRAATN